MTRYVPPSPDNVVSFGSGRGLRGANVQLEGPRPAVVEPMSRVVDSVDFRRPLLTKRERFLLGVALVLSLLALAGCGAGSAPPVPSGSERAVCSWGDPLCCSTPPSLGKVYLADIRAERWRKP